MSEEERHANFRFALFVSIVHLKYFLRCSNLFDAPIWVLEYWKDLCRWAEVDLEVSEAAKQKLSLHLEAIDAEYIWLVFFSDRLSPAEKRQMQTRLLGEIDEEQYEWGPDKRANNLVHQVRRVVKDNETKEKSVEYTLALEELEIIDLINPKVRKTSQYFGFDLTKTTFEDEQYEQMRGTLANLTAVNDAAERAVKVAKDYNSYGPQDEALKQLMLKAVSRAKQKLKGTTKADLSTELAKLN